MSWGFDGISNKFDGIRGNTGFWGFFDGISNKFDGIRGSKQFWSLVDAKEELLITYTDSF